jgi:hypothetical protein
LGHKDTAGFVDEIVINDARSFATFLLEFSGQPLEQYEYADLLLEGEIFEDCKDDSSVWHCDKTGSERVPAAINRNVFGDLGLSDGSPLGKWIYTYEFSTEVFRCSFVVWSAS